MAHGEVTVHPSWCRKYTKQTSIHTITPSSDGVLCVLYFWSKFSMIFLSGVHIWPSSSYSVSNIGVSTICTAGSAAKIGHIWKVSEVSVDQVSCNLRSHSITTSHSIQLEILKDQWCNQDFFSSSYITIIFYCSFYSFFWSLGLSVVCFDVFIKPTILLRKPLASYCVF